MKKECLPRMLGCLLALSGVASHAESTGPDTFAGFVGKGQRDQEGRMLVVGAPASSCSQPKTVPAVRPQTSRLPPDFYIDLSNRWFNDGPEQCIKVDINVPELRQCVFKSTPDKAESISLFAYAGTFDRANPQAHYLADIGTSLANPSRSAEFPSAASMTFMAPANSWIQFALPLDSLAGSGLGGVCEYSFKVSKVPTPTVAPVPTLAEWGLLGLVGVLGVFGAAVLRRAR